MKASWSALLFQISVTTHPVAVGPPAWLTMPAGQSPVPSGLIPSFSLTAQYWSDPTPSNAKTIPYDIGPLLEIANTTEAACDPLGRPWYVAECMPERWRTASRQERVQNVPLKYFSAAARP